MITKGIQILAAALGLSLIGWFVEGVPRYALLGAGGLLAIVIIFSRDSGKRDAMGAEEARREVLREEELHKKRNK